MWAAEPRMRSRSSPWRPLINAIAMISAATPTVTPSVEITEMSEMNACFRRAVRYRSATYSSKRIYRLRLLALFRGLLFRAHQREQDDVADRRTVGQHHHEAIDADALAASRRQAVFER